jgi:protein-disulfide isomerase
MALFFALLAAVLVFLPASAEAQTVQVGQAAAKGEITAPLALIEFSDLQCGYCARHNRETLPQIVDSYVKEGKLRYFLMDLPLNFHPHAFRAAVAARCAGDQGKLWEMHDLLFAKQHALEEARLPGYAAELGLDGEKFNACMAESDHPAAVRSDMAQAQELGITATPIFVLGRYDGEAGTVEVIQQIRGAKPFSVFRAAIERQLP